MTAQHFFEEHLPEQLKSDPERFKLLNATYKFIIEPNDDDKGGTWFVDLMSEVPTVTKDDTKEARCTLTIEATDFIKLVIGELPGPQAFMMNKLQIEGEMLLAMQLGNILG